MVCPINERGLGHGGLHGGRVVMLRQHLIQHPVEARNAPPDIRAVKLEGQNGVVPRDFLSKCHRRYLLALRWQGRHGRLVGLAWLEIEGSTAMIRRYGEAVQPGQAYKRRPGAYAILWDGDAMLATFQAEPTPELQLPGGGIDPGEHPAHALHREVLEETGWAISSPRRLGAFRRFAYMPEYDLRGLDRASGRAEDAGQQG